jgi:hypothetical protein
MAVQLCHFLSDYAHKLIHFNAFNNWLLEMLVELGSLSAHVLILDELSKL